MTLPATADVQHMGLFWTRRLNEPLPVPCEPRIPVTILRASSTDVEDLAVAMGLYELEPVLRRFQLGKVCEIVRTKGQLVAYGWITFDEELIGGLDLTVRLLPGEAYIWDCATLPAYRGQHLYPALLGHMLRALQQSGLSRAWIGMDADNVSSRSGVARAGFQPILDILQVRNAPVRTFLTRGYPNVSEDEVQAAQYALFGDRHASSITLPEPG